MLFRSRSTRAACQGPKRRRRISNERNRPKRLLRSSLGRRPYRGSPKKPNEVAAFHCVPGILQDRRIQKRTGPSRCEPSTDSIAGSPRFLCESHYPPGRRSRNQRCFCQKTGSRGNAEAIRCQDLRINTKDSIRMAHAIKPRQWSLLIVEALVRRPLAVRYPS